MAAIAASTRGSWAAAAAPPKRSLPSTAWERSLVPIERKSAAAAIAAALATAARVSIIAPSHGLDGERGAHGVDLRGRLDHRQQDAQLRLAAGVGDRAQLGRERGGVREQQLEPALARAGQEGRGLVGAEVEHAHRGGSPGETGEHGRERGAVLRLGRPLGGLEERELGAQEADALGAGGEPGVELGARRGVDEHADAVAVARDRGQRAVGEPALALGAAGLLGGGGGFGTGGRGREHRDPLSPVDHERLAGRGVEHRRPEPDHQRQPEPARHDGGVRRRAAPREGERDDLRPELGHVGRPELLRDEDNAGQTP